jgi:hypothetical protein
MHQKNLCQIVSIVQLDSFKIRKALPVVLAARQEQHVKKNRYFHITALVDGYQQLTNLQFVLHVVLGKLVLKSVPHVAQLVSQVQFLMLIILHHAMNVKQDDIASKILD